MTHKLILKVKKFQLHSAKRFGTVEEKPGKKEEKTHWVKQNIVQQ